MSDTSGETNERYEPVSVEWVNALRRYVTEKAAGKNLDCEVVISTECTDPPPHLLRGDGRNTIGYTIQVKNGKIEVLDGPRHEQADMKMTEPYHPGARALGLDLDTYLSWWMKERRPALEAQGLMGWVGDVRSADPIRPIIDMLGFYSKFSTRVTKEDLM